MCRRIVVIGLLSVALTNANSASPPVESCDRIRTLIKAQTGVPPKTNTELLQKLARPECRFSAAEVYRAAYGDKPMPINDAVRHRTRRDYDDDHD